jgi:ligand-binding SRPBCC domain-containing protein
VGDHVFEREQVIDAPLAEVFAFVSRPQNLARVTPAGMDFRFEGDPPTELAVGAEIRHRLKVNGLPIKWTTRIVEWDPPHRFADLQARGPYAYWRHTHSFSEVDGGRTLMRDRVVYRVPLGFLGEPARRLFVVPQLRQLFDYREGAFEAALR